MTVNILCLGDLVGGPGRDLLAEHLASFIADHNVEFVVCNAENVAGGSGLTPAIFEEIVRHGVDVVTLGDHVYRRIFRGRRPARDGRWSRQNPVAAAWALPACWGRCS